MRFNTRIWRVQYFLIIKDIYILIQSREQYNERHAAFQFSRSSNNEF